MTTLGFEGWEPGVVPKGAWGEKRYTVNFDGENYDVRLLSWEDGLLSLEIMEEKGSRTIDVVAEIHADRVEIILAGRRAVFPLDIQELSSAEAASSRVPAGPSGAVAGPVRAELPGRILEVHVKEGDRIEAGQVLIVVEAMKMEHPIRAGGDARVGEVYAEAGAQIQPGDFLLEIIPGDSG
jgi:biotin carboxyl carrier protein